MSGSYIPLPPGHPMAQLDVFGQPKVPERPAGFTAPYPIDYLSDDDEPFYYKNELLHHHMIRPDGKRLVFLFGIMATRDKYDIRYMEQELDAKTANISRASRDEINQYNMRIDPKGTMKRQLTPAIEAEVRANLETELRELMQKRAEEAGIQLSPEQLTILSGGKEPPSEEASVTSSVTETEEDNSGANLAGLEALARLRGMASVKSGNDTVLMTGSVAPLGGIVGSDKIAGASAG